MPELIYGDIQEAPMGGFARYRSGMESSGMQEFEAFLPGGPSNWVATTGKFKLHYEDFKATIDTLMYAYEIGWIGKDLIVQALIQVRDRARELCPYQPDELHERRHPELEKHLCEAIEAVITGFDYSVGGQSGLITVNTEDYEYAAKQHEYTFLQHPPKKMPAVPGMRGVYFTEDEFRNPYSGEFGQAKFIETAMDEMGPVIFETMALQWIPSLMKFIRNRRRTRAWAAEFEDELDGEY